MLYKTKSQCCYDEVSIVTTTADSKKIQPILMRKQLFKLLLLIRFSQIQIQNAPALHH